MYQVLLGDINGNNEILYYPADKECVIYDTNLSLAVGSAGTFGFKMPLINPLYGAIAQGSIITILRDGAEFWRGEVYETSKDFSGNLEVLCIEDLAWLGMEFLEPTSIVDESYAQRFQHAIQKYNEKQIGTERTFNIGYVTNELESSMCNWSTQYEWSILESIRQCICKDTGYLRVRRSTYNGVTTRYIDSISLEDFGTATQTIRFADNLLEYVEQMEMETFVNVLYPYGNETETVLYENTKQRLAGTVIEDADSVQKYGRHARAVVFDTDDLDTLNALAHEYLTKYSQPHLRFELTAIDLADISVEAHFNIGDKIKVIAEPFGIDQWVYLLEQTIDLLDVSKNTVTLSSYFEGARTLTEQALSTAEAVKDLPSKNSLLDAAKKNASEIINSNGENGHVVLHTNADGIVYEILIMDTTDMDTATKMWRWNQNGFGFRQKIDGVWENYRAAITMEGEIVADFITTGKLQAIDIEGVNINGSTITGSTFIQDTDNGKLSIHDGWIYGDSGKDAGSAIVLSGNESGRHETLYGSKYMHYSSSSVFIEAETRYVVQAGADKKSDERLKQNIEAIPEHKSVELINELRPCSYQMKDNPESTRYGFIAQEVEKALDNADLDGSGLIIDGEYLGLNYQDFIPHLINYVKDLQGQIDELKKHINN